MPLKAIIIAAGTGSRLSPLTNERPKCLLEVGGKTILERAIDALRENGVERIAVVRGYLGHLIDYPDVTYYENPRFKENNVLGSLFCAEDEMDDDFIVSYSDIIYSSAIVASLASSDADIALTTDVDWLARYDGRDGHPVSEAELVRIADGRVAKIGKGVVRADEAHGEFIGLAKFTRPASEIMRAAYHRAASAGADAPFQRAASLEKAYLADMIQELIDTGSVVTNVDIQGGWMEIDTPHDLAKARRRYG